MRKLIVFFSFWFGVTIVMAQNTERKLYSIAFYNFENLFDTFMTQARTTMSFCRWQLSVECAEVRS